MLEGLNSWADNSVNAKAKSVGGRRTGGGASSANPKADAARKWLQDNPNHPDAPAVRKKLEAMGG